MLPEKERLQHMLDAVEKIAKHTQSATKSEFLKNEMMQDAVLHQFSIIGEAIIYIDSNKLNKYDYPWHLVRAFRNYIAHEYFGINLGKVWETIRINLPELKITLEKLLKNEY